MSNCLWHFSLSLVPLWRKETLRTEFHQRGGLDTPIFGICIAQGHRFQHSSIRKLSKSPIVHSLHVVSIDKQTGFKHSLNAIHPIIKTK